MTLCFELIYVPALPSSKVHQLNTQIKKYIAFVEEEADKKVKLGTSLDIVRNEFNMDLKHIINNYKLQLCEIYGYNKGSKYIYPMIKAHLDEVNEWIDFNKYITEEKLEV